MKDMTMGDKNVYALTHNDELLARCDVTPDNVMGHCWSKVPGALAKVSGMRKDQ